MLLLRRKFVALLGGAAASTAWLGAVRAQQAMRRIGMLFPSAADDAETREWLNEFQQGLAKLGWSEGRNVHIEVRFGAGKPDRFAGLAKELVALQPDLLVGHSPPGILALKRETTAIPMLFAGVSDPVGSGLVRAWRGLAAISPACCRSSRASSANGSRCSRRSYRP